MPMFPTTFTIYIRNRCYFPHFLVNLNCNYCLLYYRPLQDHKPSKCQRYRRSDQSFRRNRSTNRQNPRRKPPRSLPTNRKSWLQCTVMRRGTRRTCPLSRATKWRFWTSRTAIGCSSNTCSPASKVTFPVISSHPNWAWKVKSECDVQSFSKQCSSGLSVALVYMCYCLWLVKKKQ